MRVLALVLTVMSLLSTSTLAQDRPTLHKTEQNIVDLTNAERLRVGLPPLKVDKALMDTSRRHCRWMSQTSSLTHSNGQYAENIACGQRSSKEALSSWMNSSGHRANILGNYRKLGVAAYKTGKGRIYWCQQFR